MKLRLVAYASTLATRERARSIAESVPFNEVQEILVDLEGVKASPSFLAQLLGDLADRAPQVCVVGTDAYHGAIVAKLIEQLGLTGRVFAAELA